MEAYLFTNGFTDSNLYCMKLKHGCHCSYFNKFTFRILPKLSYDAMNEFKKFEQEKSRKELKTLLREKALKISKTRTTLSKTNTMDEQSEYSKSTKMTQDLAYNDADREALLRQRWNNEKEANEDIMRKNVGHLVCIGDSVQMQHCESEDFICV